MLLLLCVVLAVILIVMSNYVYKELCPGKIFVLFWAFQILFLLVGGYGFLLFNYKGILFILICLFFFNIGPLSMYMGKTCLGECERDGYISYDEKKIITIVIFCTVLGFAKSINVLISHGFHLSSLLDFSSLLKINNSLAVSRYSGTLNDGNRMTQLLAVFSYGAPLVGGFAYLCCNSLRHKLVCILSLTPLLFGGLTQGVKMGIIASFFLFITGYINCSILLGKAVVLKGRTIIYGSLAIFLLISILLISMMFRIGKFDVQTFFVVRGKFIAYAFGHLPAFDMWYEQQSFLPNNLTYGGKLFMGISNFFGVLKREAGLYQDFQKIALDGSATNVYSIFRIFVEDFGIILCPMIFLILGILVQYSYIKLKKLIDFKVYSVICASFLYFTFWSFATTVFAYTTFIVLFLLYYLVLKLCVKKVIQNE